MKLGPAAKLDKRNTATLKYMTMTSYQRDIKSDVIVILPIDGWSEAISNPSDAWSIIPILALIETLPYKKWQQN